MSAWHRFVFFVTILSAVLILSCQTPANAPKNIFVFIADGCGYNQINAASIYQYGETGGQIYEDFPVKYAMSTYPANGHGYDPDSAWSSFGYQLRKATDSAASATAMATGIKTNNGIIGLDADYKPLENIIERVEKHGKATGVVTSVTFSHATPAAFVTHNESRRNYEQIAQGMILDSPIDVILGCGHPYYNADSRVTQDTSYRFVGGRETWKMLEENRAGNDADGDGDTDIWTLIQDRDDFQQLATGEAPRRLIGIAKSNSTLQQNRGGIVDAQPFEVPLSRTVPTLAEMVRVAINVVDADRDGFFLMIEGGAVDWASHDNRSGRLIEEQIDYNHAIEAAVEWIENNSSWQESLLIVTGDHETGYLWGPGPDLVETNVDVDEIWKPLVNNGKDKQPGMEWHTTKHSNSLIPFFAKGEGSDRFHAYADKTDPVRGKYIDNAAIGKVLLSLHE